MTLKQCYEAFEGDYEGVLRRLYKETLVEKFVLKFLDDPSFQNLQQGLAEHNRETAFRAAHTIKGIAQNLGFTKLSESSSRLTEMLRQEQSEEKETDALVLQLEKEYQKTVEAILAYRDA